MKKFYFNTGVRPYIHNPPVKVMPGYEVTDNGVMVIPFYCEDVPDNAVFEFACDDNTMDTDFLICREILNSPMVSKYAYFKLPKHLEPNQ